MTQVARGSSSNGSSAVKTPAVFNLAEETELLQLLRTIHRGGLKQREKNELRDALFALKQGTDAGADAVIEMLQDVGIEAVYKVAAKAEAKQKKDATQATPQKSLGRVRNQPQFAAPKETTEPKAAKVEPPAAAEEPASEPALAPEPAKESESKPEPAPEPPKAPELAPAVTPGPEPATPPPTATPEPAPQPEPPAAPAEVAQAAAAPDNDASLTRIKEIKHILNDKVGNPVALIDLDNQVGREYMNALLAAMKAVNGGPGLGAAMERLEAAFAAAQKVIAAAPASAPTAAEPAPAPVPEPPAAPAVPEPTPAPAPEPTSTPEPAPVAVPAPEPVAPAPPPPPPAPAPEPAPVVQTPPVAAASAPEPEQPHEPLSFPGEAPKPAIGYANAEPATSPATDGNPVKINVSPNIPGAAPTPAAPAATPRGPMAADVRPLQSAAALNGAPETQDSVPVINNTSTAAVAPMPAPAPTPAAAPVAPAPVAPASAVPAAEAANPSTRLLSVAKEEQLQNLMRQNQVQEIEQQKAAEAEMRATGDPLMMPEVDAGLKQLLSEWSLFKSSGFFGTGPGGIDHPLYAQMSGLTMAALIAGRFEGATPQIKQSVADYMNGWRYEEGITHEHGETFEHYLRRVIRQILDKKAGGAPTQ